jgi:RNA polymerase sigma factor (TIGR02999 family)
MNDGSNDPAPPPAGLPHAEMDRLMALVYDELRALAGSFLRGETPGQTLQPTVLVHEAYLRLVDQRQLNWNDRTHFFRIAARVMRRILVDHWRSKRAKKRAAEEVRLTLAEGVSIGEGPDVDMVAVDGALSQLEAFDPQQARIVELRFFAGLTVEETAQALGISTATVKRDWALARAWMIVELTGSGPGKGGSAGGDGR